VLHHHEPGLHWACGAARVTQGPVQAHHCHGESKPVMGAVCEWDLLLLVSDWPAWKQPA
jgi:hypothetical protein